MEIKEIYPHILDAAHALEPFYDPTVCKAGEDYGLDAAETYLLLALPTFEPQAVIVPLLNIRSPYTASEVYARRLDSITRSGLLSSNDSEHYSLTKSGTKAFQAILDAGRNAMASLAPLPGAELKELAEMLAVQAAACDAAPEPPGKWCISHSRKLDPGPGAAEIVHIDQYLSDLLAYRDDSHLESWKDLEVTGHIWDVLTLLWLNESESVDTLVQKLSHRGNSFQQTEEAVRNLVRRNWAENSFGKITITPKGREIRQAAEVLTDQYFYAPWKTLTDQQLNRLVELLIAYKDGLNV